MDGHARKDSPLERPDALAGPPRDSQTDSWEAGRAAGLAWATDEARRGYLHPVSEVPNSKVRIVIEHARDAFGGLTHGRPRAFIRGFVQGAAEFWRSHRSGRTES
jgi:hypothetical protein